MDLNQRLSPNFTLREFIFSTTAAREGIDNTPTQVEIDNAVRLCENVLQPARDHFGRSMKITSGIRMPLLNRAVRGSNNSDHIRGNAADAEFVTSSITNYDFAVWIRDNIPAYKQLILEYYTPGDPNSGWVHVSYDPADNRKENLTYDGKNYHFGLVR